MYSTRFPSVAPQALHECLRVPGLSPSNPFGSLQSDNYGLEDLERIEPHHILEAAQVAVARCRETLAHIIADPAPPTFANTIEPLQRAQGAINRVANLNGIFSVAHVFDEHTSVSADVRTLVAACRNDIQMSRGLLQRIQRLHAGVLKTDTAAGQPSEHLTDEQKMLIETMFQRHLAVGVQLGPAARTRLHEITDELEHLRAQFAANFEAASADANFWVTCRAELEGLPESRLVAMRGAARDHDPARFEQERGGYLMDIRGSYRIKDLEYLQHRSTRELVYRKARERAHDTNLPVALREATLRAEAAQILGYETHLQRKTHLEAARTPETITNLMHELLPAVREHAEYELSVLRERAQLDGIDTLEPWDVAYYLEVVRREQFNLDHAELMNYLELRNIVEYGLFHAAQHLYGLRFRRRMDLNAYHPEAQVYEVFEGAPGPRNSGIGLLILDLYARNDTTNNTWTHAFSTHVESLHTKPIVVLSGCLDAPTYGVPSLLTVTEVIDLFRSFGHMLQLLLSRSHYPDCGALELPFDFVFYPMQVNGMWATDPEVMRTYGIHVDTGEMIPHALIERIERSNSWGMGLTTAATLAATMVDLAWHSLAADATGGVPDAPRTPTEALAFERETLRAAGLDLPHLTDFPITPVFLHAFSYADSGYYTYLFADCLEAETVAWFRRHGGLNRENGEAFKRAILEPAATRRPLQAFMQFTGSTVSAHGFLRRYGFGDRPPLNL